MAPSGPAMWQVWCGGLESGGGLRMVHRRAPYNLQR